MHTSAHTTKRRKTNQKVNRAKENENRLNSIDKHFHCAKMKNEREKKNMYERLTE